MSTSTIRQSRKRKLEDMSLGYTKANFFRHQPLQNEVFHSDSATPAPSLHPRISTSMKVRLFRRRLQSRKAQSTSSSRANVVNTQLASVSRDSERKKSFKKSITELPKLFSRLLNFESKSDNESISTSEGECSVENKTTHSKTSKSKSHRWTKFMMRLTGNRIPTTAQQPEPLSSFVSFTQSSLYSNLGPNTFQVDRTLSSKLRQLPTSGLAVEDRATVTGSVRKICKSGRTISASHRTGAVSEALSPSALPRVISSIDDDFALVVYPKQEPFSRKVQSKNSRRNMIEKRHLERTLNSDGIKSSFEKMGDHFKYQRATQSSIIKSSQTVPSASKSDPFGDIPPISVPVLEPIRVKQSSWRKIQRKISKKVLRKQFSEPMEISCSDENEDSVEKNLVESLIPGKLSLSSSELYPFGDVPAIFSPVLEPVRVEVTASLTSSVRNLSDENLHNMNFESIATQAEDSNRTSSETFGKNNESVAISSETASSLEKIPLIFIPKPDPIQVQMPAALTATPNFNMDGTREIDHPNSFSEPQFQESSYNDRNVYGPKYHTDSIPVAKKSHLLQSSSSHTFSQTASTQTLKPDQNEEVSTPVSPPRKGLQEISELKSSSSGSSCISSHSNVGVKYCPESAEVELGHLKITHSSLSADSTGAVQSIVPSELDSEYAGQVFTSTSTFLGSLPEKKMLEMVPGTSSTNALTSVLSSPHRLTSYSSTSSSGNSLELTTKSAHSTTKKSTFVSKPGYSGRIIKKFAEKEAFKPYSAKEGSLQVRTASSSFSSSSTIFQNSTETINSASGHKRASISLTNLFLADSATSESVGSDAGNSGDLRGTNAEGQIEFVASSSLAADKYSDSRNADTSREGSSLIRQQSIKIKRGKTQGRFRQRWEIEKNTFFNSRKLLF